MPGLKQTKWTGMQIFSFVRSWMFWSSSDTRYQSHTQYNLFLGVCQAQLIITDLYWSDVMSDQTVPWSDINRFESDKSYQACSVMHEILVMISIFNYMAVIPYAVM